MYHNKYGKRVKLNLFPIPKSWFPRIERALGIKLTEQQKHKLFHPESTMYGERCGKTLTHCILLALSIGSPLDVESASDYGNGTLEYKRNHFIKTYIDVVEKLESVGFDTRRVGKVGGWKI